MNHLQALFAAALLPMLAVAPAVAAEKPLNAFNATTQTAPYLEPIIERPEQDAAAADKLSALEKRSAASPTS